MPALTIRLVREPSPDPVTIPEALRVEVEITKKLETSIETMENLGERSNFSCPDCGGSLWSIDEGKNRRYRCHVGHAYTEDLLDELQDKTILESVVVAIRMMEEKSDFLAKIAGRTPEISDRRHYYEKRLDANNRHIGQMKRLMVALHEATPAEDG